VDKIYRENILFHYKNPQNTEKIQKPTHSSRVANYSCGDETEIELKVVNGIVKSVSHQTRGCAISVAGASILSEFIEGKEIEEIKKIDKEKVIELMGIEVTPSRLKCALLGFESLKKALGSKL